LLPREQIFAIVDDLVAMDGLDYFVYAVHCHMKFMLSRSQLHLPHFERGGTVNNMILPLAPQ
jgi:hypothetical protein